MNKPYRNTVKYTLEEMKKLHDNTDYAKLDNMSDSDIDYSDIPEMDDTFWSNAQVYDPGTKKAISLRVDPDVLTWFKQQGGRYQRLMNQVLRQYMDAHRR